MRPNPAAVMAGAAAWAQKKGPFRLTARGRESTSSSVVSAKAEERKLAAELTSTSTPPRASWASATTRRHPSAEPRSPPTTTARTPRARQSEAVLLGRLAGGAVVHRDVEPHVGELQAERAAHPYRAAGDQRPPARQGRGHPRPSSAAIRRVARPRWEMAAFSAWLICAIERSSPSGRNRGS